MVAATIAMGCILRLWQLASGPSFWLDELTVVRNIVHLPLGRLLGGPLAYGQVAPIGFLAVGRALATLIPDHDWVFRVVPLTSSVLLLPLIYALGRRAVGSFPAVAATALVASSPPMIGLSSVAKQYSADVFVSAALMYGGWRILSREVERPRELLRLGVLGGLLLCFSHPGVLVAFALGVVVAGRWLVERRPGWEGRVAVLGLPLVSGAVLTTLTAVRARAHDTAAYMAEFWAAGFPPMLADTPAWLWRQLSEIYEAAFLTPYPLSGLAAFWPMVLLGLGLVGVPGLVRHDRAAAAVVLAPLAAAAAAAAAHVYPLAGRLSLFLTPSLALLSVSGGVSLGRLVGRIARRAEPVVYSATVVPTVLTLIVWPPPYGLEHTRPLLHEMAEEWLPTDAVYSYYAANHAVDYYGDRFGITGWRAGTCQRGNPRAYLEELDEFRGRSRVWVVFTHVLPPYAEAQVILGYLRTIGSERRALLSQQDIRMTSAFLFDLSDPVRLGRTSAREYLPRSDVAVDTRLSCGLSPVWDWERPER